MDKVKDESPPLEKRKISFINEDGEKVERGLITEEESVGDLHSIDWDKNPPVAEIKVSNKYYQKERKVSERAQRLYRVLSLSIVIFVIFLFWLVMLIPQLCFFQVGLCRPSSTESGSNENLNSNMTCTNATQYRGICQTRFSTCTTSPLVNSNATLESDLALVFAIISDSNSVAESCFQAREDVETFLCRYAYQPCSEVDNRVVLPNRSYCERVRDQLCTNEWDILMELPYGAFLPDCSVLPNVTIEPKCDSLGTTVSATTTTSVVPTTTQRVTTVTPTPSPPPSCDATYSDSICLPYLDVCPDTDPIVVNSYNDDIQTSLDSAHSLFTTSAGPTCRSAGESVFRLLCGHLLQPCDDKGIVHYPNRSHCETIRDDVCRSEWQTIQFIGQGGILPDCSLLPESDTPLSCDSSSMSSVDVYSTPYSLLVDPTLSSSLLPSSQVASVITSALSLTSSPSPTVTPPPANAGLFNVSLSFTCNEAEGFFLYIMEENDTRGINNTCQARCSKWIIFESQTAVEVRDYLQLSISMLGLLAAFAVIFFSIIRYKRMFLFPSMYIVYQTVSLMGLGIILFVQYIDRYGLSCSSDDLVITTIANPTVFCSISGYIILYVIFSVTLWWFIHVSSTFWKVMFPFHARKHESKTKYIHAISLVVGIILPFVGPTIAALVDGYTMHRFPPILCAPANSKVLYYTTILPISLMVCIGLTFLVIILHVLHQKQRLFKHRGTVSYFLGLSTAEKKLLIIFFYYIIVGIFDVAGYSVSLATTATLVEDIKKTFLCEARPYDPNYTCPKDYQDAILSDSFAIILYAVLGFFPFTNLLFAVNIAEVKDFFKKCFGQTNLEATRSRTGSTTAGYDAPDTPFTLKRKISYAVSNNSYYNKENRNDSIPGGTVGRNGVYTQRTTTL